MRIGNATKQRAALITTGMAGAFGLASMLSLGCTRREHKSVHVYEEHHSPPRDQRHHEPEEQTIDEGEWYFPDQGRMVVEPD